MPARGVAPPDLAESTRGLSNAWKVRSELKLDIELNVFFLPYTYLYHRGYESLRLRLVGAI